MGDRCYFSVSVMREDAESEAGLAILEDVGDEAPERDGDVLRYSDGNMNYGGSDFLEAWADAGFICEGSQEGGGSYGPSSFITTGGKITIDGTEYEGLFEAYTGKQGWGYVVGFDASGAPSASDISIVKGFILLRKEVEERMTRTPIEWLAAAHNTERDEE